MVVPWYCPRFFSVDSLVVMYFYRFVCVCVCACVHARARVCACVRFCASVLCVLFLSVLIDSCEVLVCACVCARARVCVCLCQILCLRFVRVV